MEPCFATRTTDICLSGKLGGSEKKTACTLHGVPLPAKPGAAGPARVNASGMGVNTGSALSLVHFSEQGGFGKSGVAHPLTAPKNHCLPPYI